MLIWEDLGHNLDRLPEARDEEQGHMFMLGQCHLNWGIYYGVAVYFIVVYHLKRFFSPKGVRS